MAKQTVSYAEMIEHLSNQIVKLHSQCEHLTIYLESVEDGDDTMDAEDLSISYPSHFCTTARYLVDDVYHLVDAMSALFEVNQQTIFNSLSHAIPTEMASFKAVDNLLFNIDELVGEAYDIAVWRAESRGLFSSVTIH